MAKWFTVGCSGGSPTTTRRPRGASSSNRELKSCLADTVSMMPFRVPAGATVHCGTVQSSTVQASAVLCSEYSTASHIHAVDEQREAQTATHPLNDNNLFLRGRSGKKNNGPLSSVESCLTHVLPTFVTTHASTPHPTEIAICSNCARPRCANLNPVH